MLEHARHTGSRTTMASRAGADDALPQVRIRPGVYFAAVDGEGVLMDLPRDKYFGLSGASALVWQGLADGKPLAEVTADLATALRDEDAEAIAQRMDAQLAAWRQAGLLADRDDAGTALPASKPPSVPARHGLDRVEFERTRPSLSAFARHADAVEFAKSRENAWSRLAGIIHESRNLAAAWKTAGPEERKILLDYWVLDVLIVVKPVPGKRRANRKVALVTLRTAPNAPLDFDLGLVQPSDAPRAPRNSRRTSDSVSTAARARSASSAAGEPIRPSAHATCARTSGSGSSKAAASAGTSSDILALPNDTDALRLSPRSLARFMGEPLNAAEYSGGDMDKMLSASERASLPATASRGAKARSDKGRENLRLYGQTSWQMSQP